MAVVTGTTLAAVAQLIGYSTWRGVVVAALIPLEVTLACAAMLRPKSFDGVAWQHADLDALRSQLKVRSDVRTVARNGITAGGQCQQRWGRDVVVIDAGLFLHHEQLAVVAHEFGHTKQSPLVRPVTKAMESVLLAAVWVWLLPGAWLTVALGLAIGSVLWVSMLYLRRFWIRRSVAWAAWLWWLATVHVTWPALVGAAAGWAAWRLAVTYSMRVSEHLADEAVIAVERGPEALSAALARLSGGPRPRWRQAFSSHPSAHQRGSARR